MKNHEDVLAIVEELKKLYPEGLCSLQYPKPYELLFSVRLAAQCTDERVNMVTPALFARFPTLESLAQADPAEVETYIHSTGFFRAKARDIVAASRMLVEQYGGLLAAVVRRHAPGLDAEDLLADALLTIWRNAGRFDGTGSFRNWAAAVARYRAIDAVRRAGRVQPGGGAAELELLGGHTADEYFALELEDLFRELEPADRELLLERYFYGASPAEAAAKRGVSVSAVNTRVSRAKTRLAQTLERSGKR